MKELVPNCYVKLFDYCKNKKAFEADTHKRAFIHEFASVVCSSITERHC